MTGGSEPCDALQAELALDLLEGELAVEMPPHMRAFARAHADNRPPPAAPLLARLASTLKTARDACMHDFIADRGVALLRLVLPLVIEDDAAVKAARAASPTWDNLGKLAAARDAAAQARFGTSARELLHRLFGVEDVRARPRGGANGGGWGGADGGGWGGGDGGDDGPGGGGGGDSRDSRDSREHMMALGPPVDGWHVPDAPLDSSAIHDAWQAIVARFGIVTTGQLRIDRSREPKTQPRAFVVEPKHEVIIVVPEHVDTPAARFAVLHELGHAVVALALPAGTPRVVDEAAASYIARFSEPPTWLPPRWESELAPPARRRRLALATMLDEIERGLPTLADVPSTNPPWALWNDPFAQAAYVEAERMADQLAKDLGPNPPRGQLVRALQAERDRIDHRTRLW